MDRALDFLFSISCSINSFTKKVFCAKSSDESRLLPRRLPLPLFLPRLFELALLFLQFDWLISLALFLAFKGACFEAMAY